MAFANRERFALILPSNSSMNFYPDNTLTNFRTKLSTSYDLQDEWSVALTSIALPTSRTSIDGPTDGSVQYRLTSDVDPKVMEEMQTERDADRAEHENTIKNGRAGLAQNSQPPFVAIPRMESDIVTPVWPKNKPLLYLGSARPSWANMQIPLMNEISEWIEMKYDSGNELVQCVNGNTQISGGRYRDMQALIAELRSAIGLTADNEARRGVIMRYDEKKRRFSVTLRKCTALAFSAPLSRILGFDKPFEVQNVRREQITVYGDRAADVQTFHYNLHVHLDILEEQIVGDALVNLLYMLPMSHQDGEYTYHEVEHLQYVPIKKKYFDEITVRLRGDGDEPVPFEIGKVVLSLDFRKDAPSWL